MIGRSEFEYGAVQESATGLWHIYCRPAGSADAYVGKQGFKTPQEAKLQADKNFAAFFFEDPRCLGMELQPS